MNGIGKCMVNGFMKDNNVDVLYSTVQHVR